MNSAALNSGPVQGRFVAVVCGAWRRQSRSATRRGPGTPALACPVVVSRQWCGNNHGRVQCSHMVQWCRREVKESVLDLKVSDLPGHLHSKAVHSGMKSMNSYLGVKPDLNRARPVFQAVPNCVPLSRLQPLPVMPLGERKSCLGADGRHNP